MLDYSGSVHSHVKRAILIISPRFELPFLGFQKLPLPSLYLHILAFHTDSFYCSLAVVFSSSLLLVLPEWQCCLGQKYIAFNFWRCRLDSWLSPDKSVTLSLSGSDWAEIGVGILHCIQNLSFHLTGLL